jgi:hypothetical protein
VGLLVAAGLTGCSVTGAAGTGGSAARAAHPCTLLTRSELAALGRARLGSGFAVDGQEEAAGNPGSRVCQYRLRVPASDGAGDPAGSQADAGLELYAYTSNARRALSYYRSLTSDGEALPGLGDGAWWSTHGQQLLVVRGQTLVLAHFQLPRAYRERSRALALDLGGLTAGRL